MKKLLIAFTILAFSSVSVFAMPNNEVELMLISKMAQKKAIVLATMNLKGKEKEKFGKLYDEYQQKLGDVIAKQLKIITTYAENYESLTDQQANKLIEDWFAAKQEALKLQESFNNKFEKVLSPVQLIKFLQIENKFRIIREAEIANAVPLAKPVRVEKKK
jgi:hypothetical protein